MTAAARHLPFQKRHRCESVERLLPAAVKSDNGRRDSGAYKGVFRIIVIAYRVVKRLQIQRMQLDEASQYTGSSALLNEARQAQASVTSAIDQGTSTETPSIHSYAADPDEKRNDESQRSTKRR